MTAIILLMPLVLSILVFIRKSRSFGGWCNVAYAGTLLAASVCLYVKPGSFTVYFRTDEVSILFLLILAVLYLGVSLYNTEYIRHKNGESAGRHALYAVHLLLFAASMVAVILSTHLGLLWVFVEATTLSSAYLIYFNRTEAALEAAWKYIFICSVGIALAFVGIIFLSMGLGHSDSLFFDDLYKNAKNINPFWLKLALSFILIGFGTKVGFAPVHAWLPDAHSESPSPVSALLSGTLLNAALLGVIRVSTLLKLAGLEGYVSQLLLLMGFLSLFVSAVFVIRIENYKRMLAYSSIENMGIIAIGLGIGGPGVFAAMLHLTAHSLIKASLFLTSGTVEHCYGSKMISEVRGLLHRDKITGWLWMLSFVAIAGIPPFPLFFSEFFIARTLFANGSIVYAVIFFLLLTIVLAAMARAVLGMCFGENRSAEKNAVPSEILTWLPQTVFLVLLFLMAALPDGLCRILQNAAAGL
ncbi:MAG: proton-conducting transporter membrane subunit [Desulfobacterales bacterium]